MGGSSYIGTELDLFATATSWKRTWRSQVRPYLGRRVLEVGAGIGGTTSVLCGGEEECWVCLEPDESLLRRIASRIDAGSLPACCSARRGTLADLDPGERFDTVLYIDVLEHIRDDRAELGRAAERLMPGGHLVVLAPAHAWLYTPFDEAVGHCRRYTRGLLADAVPRNLAPVRLRYLDSVGMLASLANRLFLSQREPTSRQIWIWDRLLVPLSRGLDPLLGYSLGKSVLGVWRLP